MYELLRSIHRKLGIKYRIGRWIHYAQRFGMRGAVVTRRRIWAKSQGVQTVEIPGLAYAVALRTGTADASTLEKIFVWNDYDLAYPDDVKTIIDAGANIGLSAIFFATRFPEATIVAIEPESANFDLLQRNTHPYPKIIPLRAALWSEDMTLGLTNPGDHVDSYRYGAAATQDQVAALSVPSLLKRFGLELVDVMKIDIEGAEAQVFAGAPPWVGQVGMFIIELHGDPARDTFLAATSSLLATRYRHGEDEIVRVR
ncbi:MAG: FkbM family methyltransferase [Thermoanaerobaculia bacterium]